MRGGESPAESLALGGAGEFAEEFAQGDRLRQIRADRSFGVFANPRAANELVVPPWVALGRQGRDDLSLHGKHDNGRCSLILLKGRSGKKAERFEEADRVVVDFSLGQYEYRILLLPTRLLRL